MAALAPLWQVISASAVLRGFQCGSGVCLGIILVERSPALCVYSPCAVPVGSAVGVGMVRRRLLTLSFAGLEVSQGGSAVGVDIVW